jgi:hypothetical protein
MTTITFDTFRRQKTSSLNNPALPNTKASLTAGFFMPIYI